VFANGSEATTLWEFKHGGGNFRRGDLVGLREIKRRASRHALVHREYNNQKPTPSQPGTPAEPMPMPDGSDPRLAGIDHTLYEVSARMQRSEENAHYLHIKQQAVMDSMSRLLQFNQELSRIVLQLVPNPENQLHREGKLTPRAASTQLRETDPLAVVSLQSEIQRQADMIRTLDEPHETPYPSRGQYFAGIENAPVSPRQIAQDDPRRGNLAVPQNRAQNFYRPAVPSSLSVATRRPYGSIGASTSQPSPNSLRPQIPPPPPAPHPLSAVEPPPGSLARRHTSADIRAHGWQAGPPPLGAGAPPVWPPPSPNRAAGPEDQRIRDSFSSYSLQTASQPHSRPETPPPPFSNGNSGLDSLSNWSWNSANRNDNNNRLSVKDSSAPPTRRGSMAHILNPTDTAERENEDEDPQEDRKRKRMQ